MLNPMTILPLLLYKFLRISVHYLKMVLKIKLSKDFLNVLEKENVSVQRHFSCHLLGVSLLSR